MKASPVEEVYCGGIEFGLEGADGLAQSMRNRSRRVGEESTTVVEANSKPDHLLHQRIRLLHRLLDFRRLCLLGHFSYLPAVQAAQSTFLCTVKYSLGTSRGSLRHRPRRADWKIVRGKAHRDGVGKFAPGGGPNSR